MPHLFTDASMQSVRHLRFVRHMLLPLVVVPTLVLLFYASLVFLPRGPSPGLLTWMPANHSTASAQTSAAESLAGQDVAGHGVWTICPRETICSEGAAQLLLLAIARLSAYSLYVCLAVAMLSKCYCILYFLRSTALALWVPFQWLHNLHRVVGIGCYYGSVVHTLAHLARWALRSIDRSGGSVSSSGRSGGAHFIGLMLIHPTGLSGLIAVTLLVLAVSSMHCREFVMKRLKLTYETRHLLHLLVAPMLVVLCWHHQNVAIFCAILLSVWLVDRTYLFLFKTIRVEEVTFTRLSDGSVQMCWRNPRDRRPRAGEYVRVMVPSISRELHPYSTFEYFPQNDGALTGDSTQPFNKKARASTCSATNHVHAALDAMRRASKPTIEARTTELRVDVEMGRGAEAPRGRESDMQHDDDPGWGSWILTPTPGAAARGGVDRELHELATANEALVGECRKLEESSRAMEKMVRKLKDDLDVKATYSQVLIGPFGDWSKSLSEQVRQWSESGSSWVGPCYIQGPFTSPFNASIGYGRLILVVTGIGVTAALPIVQQMHCLGREVFLIWITRSKEQISFQLPMLLSCTSTLCVLIATLTHTPSRACALK